MNPAIQPSVAFVLLKDVNLRLARADAWPDGEHEVLGGHVRSRLRSLQRTVRCGLCVDGVAVRQKENVLAEPSRDGRTLGGHGLSVHRIKPFWDAPGVIDELGLDRKCALERHECPRLAVRGESFGLANGDVRFAQYRVAVV